MAFTQQTEYYEWTRIFILRHLANPGFYLPFSISGPQLPQPEPLGYCPGPCEKGDQCAGALGLRANWNNAHTDKPTENGKSKFFHQTLSIPKQFWHVMTVLPECPHGCDRISDGSVCQGVCFSREVVCGPPEVRSSTDNRGRPKRQHWASASGMAQRFTRSAQKQSQSRAVSSTLLNLLTFNLSFAPIGLQSFNDFMAQNTLIWCGFQLSINTGLRNRIFLSEVRSSLKSTSQLGCQTCQSCQMARV